MADTPDKGPASDRRAFFRQALQKAAGPVADAVEAALPLRSSRSEEEHQYRLRPPGAIQEALFLGTCYRSGNCMDACPADAIQPLKSADPNLSGTPTVIPSIRACVVCDTLACMDACPSGALQKVARTEIQMGVAVVMHEPCLRTRDQDCIKCIEICPIGRAAIGLTEVGSVAIGAAACVGCGLCEEVCPTSPKAIRVYPIGR